MTFLKKALVVVLLLLGFYSTRAAFPYPSAYLTRARWLQGYKGLNCAGFVLNAHGDKTLSTLGALQDTAPLYNGLNGKLKTVSNLKSKNEINEEHLRAGDVVFFGGANGHVVLFLEPGRWIDSDFRRGTVKEFSLQEKTNDTWFSGNVRVLRWKEQR
jgi:hypothetical protein